MCLARKASREYREAIEVVATRAEELGKSKIVTVPVAVPPPQLSKKKKRETSVYAE